MKKLTAVLCVLMLAITGCGKKAQTRTIEGDVTGQGVSIDTEAEAEDSVTISVNMAKTLNPLVNSDESVDMALSLLYEKLIVIGADGKAEPNIAQSWTFNEDGSVAYIDLRNDVCFSDGTRLTAYDVAYSLKTIDNADNSYYKNCVENIKTWSVTGDYSISVTFYESTGRNIYYLAIPIISRTFYGGDYDYFLWKKSQTDAQTETRSTAAPEHTIEKTTANNDHKRQKETRNLINRLQKESQRLLSAIETAEERLRQLHAEWSREECYSDPQKSAAAAEAVRQTEDEIAKLTDEWEETENRLASAQAGENAAALETK